MTDNLKGALLMTLAMAAFALQDVLIKLTAPTVGAGFVLLFIGFFGALAFGAVAKSRGVALWDRAIWSRPVLARNISEVGATVCFVTSLALNSLSLTTAMIQATPLVVTLGAALLFRARVGWRRWCAILVGLGGVLVILRPGAESFTPAALWAVGAMAFLAFRDLATRAVPRSVATAALATWALITLVPTGSVLMLISGAPSALSLALVALLGGGTVMGLLAYYAIIEAMRIGEVAVVTPFRYTRLLFGLTLAFTIFGERPDRLTLIGAAIVLAAGLYTLWREARAVAKPSPLS